MLCLWRKYYYKLALYCRGSLCGNKSATNVDFSGFCTFIQVKIRGRRVLSNYSAPRAFTQHFLYVLSNYSTFTRWGHHSSITNFLKKVHQKFIKNIFEKSSSKLHHHHFEKSSSKVHHQTFWKNFITASSPTFSKKFIKSSSKTIWSLSKLTTMEVRTEMRTRKLREVRVWLNFYVRLRQ